MAAGFDLGSIYSTLDLDFSGFLKGIEQARSAITNLKHDFDELARSAQQAFDSMGRNAEAAAARMQTAFTGAARGAAQGAANAAAAAGMAVATAVASTSAGANIIPFTMQPVPIGPYTGPSVPSIPPPRAPLALPPGGGGGGGGGGLLPQYTGPTAGALVPQFTALAGQATSFGQTMAQAAVQAGGAFAGLGQTLGSFFGAANQQFNTLGRSLLSFRTILLGLGVIKIVGDLGEFDQKIAQLRSVVQENAGFTEASFGRMRQAALQLGATTIFSASQAAAGMTELARAGFGTDEVLQMIRPTLQMASIEHMNLAEATKIVSNVMRTFNLEAADATRVTDILTKASAISSTSVTGIGNAMRYVGPLAQNLGVSLETTAAAIATLSQKGVDRSMAGTTVRNVLTALIQDVPRHTRVLKEMGLTLDDIDPKTRGFAGAFQALRDHGLDASRAMVLFGQRAGPGALGIAENLEVLRQFEDQLKNAAGTTERMAVTATNNLKDAFGQLRNVLEVAVLQLGDSGVSGVLRSLVDGLTNAFRAMTGFIDPLSAAAPTAYALSAALQGLLIVLAGLAAIKIGASFLGLVAAAPELAALALAIGAVVTVYGLMTGESQRFAQAQANVNSLIQRMGEVSAATSTTVITGLKAEAEAMIAKERTALAQLMPTPEGFTTAERPLLATGMKLPFGVEIPGLQTYNEEAAAKRAALASDPRVKQLQDNIARMEAAKATMPEGVTAGKAPAAPYAPYRDTGRAAQKAAQEAFQAEKQAVEALLEKHHADLELLRTTQAVQEAKLQHSHDEVGAAALHADQQQRILDLQVQQNAQAQIEYERLLAMAVTEAQRVDARGHLARLATQAAQIPVQRDLATVQGQMALEAATFRRGEGVLGQAFSLADLGTATQGEVAQIQGETRLRQLQRQGASQALLHREDLLLQQQGMATDLQRNAIRQQGAQADLAWARQNNQETLKYGETLTRLRAEQDILEARRHDLDAKIAAAPTTLGAAAMTAAQDIVDAFLQGGGNLAQTMSSIGSKLASDSIGSLTKGFDFLKDLGLGLSESTQQLIKGGIGIAIVGITSLLKGTKAEVTSLGEQSKNQIESVEKTKGLIAGEQNIAIQQLSGNLGAAFRPTNEILLRLEALLRLIATAETGQPIGELAGYAITNQLYASELLGSARLS